MKQSSLPILVSFSLAAIGLAASSHTCRADDGSLQAGAVAMDITPLPEHYPISVNGGMSDRLATEAHDPLHARCIVLDDGSTSLAIVVCDSCMIPRDVFDIAKARASEATGIPTQNMLTSATHTHTAPTATGVFQSDPDEPYRQYLSTRIAEAIIQAHAQLEPAQVGWGVGSDPTQVFNRRWFTQQGVLNEDPFGNSSDVVRMNPGFSGDVNREPSGPVDPEVCLLSVQAIDGRPIALLANYSLHYVGGVPALSADYFGEFATRIMHRIDAENVSPPFVGIMSNGTSGNINNINYGSEGYPAREPFEQIQVVAASVADAAYRAYNEIEYHTSLTLATSQREVELVVRLPTEADLDYANEVIERLGPGPYSDRFGIYARETVLLAHYPPKVKALLQAFRIGDLGIVSSPCETFVETGLAIKEASPLDTTFCIELANGYNGYLPTPEHHQWGGYETWRARSSYLDAEAEPIVRNTLIELLREISEQHSLSGDPSILPSDSRLEMLWNAGEFTEGVAVAPDGTIVFSDIPGTTPGKVYRFDPTAGTVDVLSHDSGKSNGLMYTRDGRLIACCGANDGLRALCEIKPDGEVVELVTDFEGHRFNAPNDLVIHPDGAVYFSDPFYVGSEQRELDHMSVYRVDLESGEVTRATTTISKPNGLIFSPDGHTLYVAETNNGVANPNDPNALAEGVVMRLHAFDVAEDGTLSGQRMLVDFGEETGIDGMTMDVEGHIYAAVRSQSRFGIAVFSDAGEELAFIPTPDLPTNCCFGVGDEAKTLFVTAGGGLYRIRMGVEGHHPSRS